MKMPMLRGHMAALCLFALAASRAGAIVITQSNTVTLSGHGDSGNDWTSSNSWNFSGFNSALGVLQSVTLSATVTATVSAFEHNAFSFDPLKSAYNYTPGVHLNLNANTTFDSLALPAPFPNYSASATGAPVVLTFDQTNTFSAVLTASGTVSSSNAGILANFSSAGTHLALTTLQFGGNNFYGGTSVTGNVTTTITYNYIATAGAPADTPEGGSTFVLLAMPLAAFVWFRRR